MTSADQKRAYAARAMSALTHPAAQTYAAHVNAAFVKVLGAFGSGRVWVRAKGTSLWDADGREYLDFLAASGAASLGHNPPKVLDRLREVLADDAAGFAEAGVSVAAGDLAAALARLAAPLTRVIPATTRGEAIDSALKLARAATKRPALVATEPSPMAWPLPVTEITGPCATTAEPTPPMANVKGLTWLGSLSVKLTVAVRLPPAVGMN